MKQALQCHIEQILWTPILRIFLFSLVFLSMSNGVTQAATSSVLGGSLLDEGEVAISAGIGFPDAFVQFDFANSRRLNLALRGSIQYNYGFPIFGVYGSISAPLRIGLIQPPSFRIKDGRVLPETRTFSPWSASIQIHPGLLFMGISPEVHQYTFGVSLGLSVIVGYQVSPKLHVFFGLDFPMSLTIEPSNVRNAPIGFNLPIEAVGGVEYNVHPKWSLFARLAIGPMVYWGQFARQFALAENAVSGSGRLWLGVSWRR